MRTHATATFEQKTWDEEPYTTSDDGPKLTRASVTQIFHGAIEGEGSVEYLMVYPDATSASFVGLQRVTGQVGGRTGSVVFQVSGTFADSTVHGTWVVVPGSGTGELRALRAEGSFVAPTGPQASLTLDYDFE
jgi:hypothetical protein